ncbi:MAG TPA: hypothetical protein VL172_10940 [Kofleriaceae bacterium]|nr:hypothetical protein [Kofleriaceae bacterium]
MRARTIVLLAAGVLVLGAFLYLAIDVSRGSGSGATPSAAGDDGAHHGRGTVAAQRSLPTPRSPRAPAAEVDDADPAAAPAAPPARPPVLRGPHTPMAAVGAAAGAGALPGAAPATSNSDPEQDEKMADATASYDSGDYQAAQEKALAILESSPRNIKMLRIAVSTSCMFGDLAKAKELNARLPKAQQEQMRRRCKKNGGDI